MRGADSGNWRLTNVVVVEEAIQPSTIDQYVIRIEHAETPSVCTITGKSLLACAVAKGNVS